MMPRKLRVPRIGRRVIAVLAVVPVLLGGAWLWVRDSSLVAVKRVVVQNATGPDAAQIRRALTSAARSMTTLDVHTAQLRTAVAPYPAVKDVQVSTQFPHGLRIRVIEQIPVGAVAVGGRTIAVAGDGTLLHDLPASSALPSIPVRAVPGGERLTWGDGLEEVTLLSAAPYPMISRISQVTTVADHGLVAQLRGGPQIYFGEESELSAKWTAATAVLADAGSAGADYIDVTDPHRPAAGSNSPSAPSPSSAADSANASAASTGGG